MPERPVVSPSAAQLAAARISEYLIGGMNHMTREAQEVMTMIIDDTLKQGIHDERREQRETETGMWESER